jgi:cystathionine beta-synthase
MARRLTREEGLFAGGSAGLIVALATKVARAVDDPAALIVCILPDTGERYLSKVYNDEWLRENRFLEPERLSALEMVARKDRDGPHLIAVERATTVREALRLITDNDISQLPVIEDGECVGSVHESLLMSRIIEDPAMLDRAVADIMEAPFPVVDAELPVSRVGRLLNRQCPAVLVRVNGVLGGIITRYDVVRYLAL